MKLWLRCVSSGLFVNVGQVYRVTDIGQHSTNRICDIQCFKFAGGIGYDCDRIIDHVNYNPRISGSKFEMVVTR